MIVIKTSKNNAAELYGTFLGNSRIDGKPMYRFESFEEFIKTGISTDDCQIVSTKEQDEDFDKAKTYQPKNIIFSKNWTE
jgi:hypothetical protein